MTENITVFNHNSIRIKTGSEGAGNRNIYIDPFQMKIAPKDADFILITHDHYDHFSPEDIEKVAGANTILIVPEKMEHKVQEVSGLVSRIVTVRPGETYTVDGAAGELEDKPEEKTEGKPENKLEFETVPAYNMLKPFHPKSAGWVGYILLIDGKRIYVAGDTDATKEAKAVKCDIALVPIGGTYTMDAKQAAALVNTIRPEVAIPVHYGSIVGSPEDAKVFKANVKEPVRVEIKIS